MQFSRFKSSLILALIVCGFIISPIRASVSLPFTNETTGNGLGDNIVISVYVSGNNVYAATYGGLSILTNGGTSFTNYTTSAGLGSNAVNGVYVSGNTVYAATKTGLSISTSTNGGRSFTNYTTSAGLGSNAVYGVYVSGSTVYAATNGGLSISTSTNGGRSFTNYTTSDGLGSNSVYGVYVSGNNVYAATYGGLSILTNGGTSFTNYTTSAGLGSNYVNGVYVSGNNVYAATNGGLSISTSTNGGTRFTNYTTSDGLGDNYVLSVYVSGSTVYAATNGGLSISTNGGTSFTNYTTSDGLGSNSVYGVYVSGNNVYAATNGGLSILTLPSVSSALTASGTVGTAFSYTITGSGGSGSYLANSFTATPLPAGLSINSSTGVISGTPTAAGATNVTIAFQDALGFPVSSATLVLTINGQYTDSAGHLYTYTDSTHLTDSNGNTYTYTDSGTYATITNGFTYAASPAIIPASVPNGHSVTSIGDFAFTGCTSLSSVSIGSNVTSIGDYAFNDCTSLSSVSIGSNVTSIGGCAFNDCTSLNRVTFNETVAPTISSNSFNIIKPGAQGFYAYVATGYTSSPFSTAVSGELVMISGTTVNSALTVSGTVGSTFTYTITGAGGSGNYANTFTATPLPSGLTLNVGTGVISGTPTSAGTTSVVIGLQDSVYLTPAASATLQLTISNPAPVIVPKIAAGISITNTTQTYTGKPLPVTTSLSPSTLSAAVVYYPGFNVPTDAGTYYVLVNVVDNTYYGSQSSVLTILPAAQTVSLATPTTLSIGVPVSLSATSTTNGPITYSVVSGNATLTGSTLTALDSNSVTIKATQAGTNNYQSASATVTLTANPIKPAITVQPASTVTVNQGSSTTLSITATGTSPSYQWYLGSTAIAGATSSTYTITSASSASAGSYTCVVTNSLASVTSTPEVVSVIIAPTITSNPTNQLVRSGSSATFIVNATGTSPTYQWNLNGTPIAGATSASYTVTASSSTTGNYTCTISNAAGSVTTPAATLTLNTTHLANLSSRAVVGTSNLTVGFVSTGSDAKSILLRGDGPSLANYGVTGVLASPVLTLYNSAGTSIAANSAWGGSSTLSTIFTQVGAFPLTATSNDAVLNQSLTSGTYSAIVTGANSSTGAAMVEIYDADPTGATSRLVNISARGIVGSGTSIMTGGFVITGNSTETILIRAVGPTLSNYGVTGVLAQPTLTVYNASGTSVASNTIWGGGSTLSSAMTQVGAFALPSTSADSAVLVTLPAGAYTVQVSGVNGTTGNALVEIYEVSSP